MNTGVCNRNSLKLTDENYRNEIKGTAAGLVIGDRALEQRKHSTFIYDLGAEWRFVTGLPFVFAAWVSNKKLPDHFIEKFNEANAIGLNHIDEIVAEHPFPAYDLEKVLHFSHQLPDWMNGRKKEWNCFYHT